MCAKHLEKKKIISIYLSVSLSLSLSTWNEIINQTFEYEFIIHKWLLHNHHHHELDGRNDFLLQVKTSYSCRGYEEEEEEPFTTTIIDICIDIIIIIVIIKTPKTANLRNCLLLLMMMMMEMSSGSWSRIFIIIKIIKMCTQV